MGWIKVWRDELPDHTGFAATEARGVVTTTRAEEMVVGQSTSAERAVESIEAWISLVGLQGRGQFCDRLVRCGDRFRLRNPIVWRPIRISLSGGVGR